MHLRRSLFSPLLLVLLPGGLLAQAPLAPCADQFPGGRLAAAPTVRDTPVSAPAPGNRQLCFRDGAQSFYALEYSSEHSAPLWAAYRLNPAHYGEKGCSTFMRPKSNCYFRAQTWSAFEACDARGDRIDPFHVERQLQGGGLQPPALAQSGHDRGLLAQREAFSWHVCASYQTVSMANVVPMKLHLKLGAWRALERQVLTWAVDVGPLYVVSGPVYARFPERAFEVYRVDRLLDADQIYPRGTALGDLARTHQANFNAYEEGHVLRPRRVADPDKIPDEAAGMPVPTGFFKVIYRPATDDEPAHAIAFLLPHSFEDIDQVTRHYAHLEERQAFWLFVARISLIEELTRLRFPGIDAPLKASWNDRFFLARRGARNTRAARCGDGTPQGILEGADLKTRIAACLP